MHLHNYKFKINNFFATCEIDWQCALTWTTFRSVMIVNWSSSRENSEMSSIYVCESRELQLLVHCKGIASAYETNSSHFRYREKKSLTKDEIRLVEEEVKLLNDFLASQIPSVVTLKYGLILCCCTCCISMIPFFVSSSTVCLNLVCNTEI